MFVIHVELTVRLAVDDSACAGVVEAGEKKSLLDGVGFVGVVDNESDGKRVEPQGVAT